MTVTIYQTMIVVVIASIFIGGMGAYFVEVNKKYDLNLSEGEFDMFDQIQTITNLSEEQARVISGSDLDKEAESVTRFFVGAFSAVKRVLTSPFNMAKLGKAMITDTFSVLERLGIPNTFSYGIAAILSVIIAFGLIRAVLKVIP